MNKFKNGDLVVLKSGGPRMTVDAATSDGVYATWFSGSTHKRAHFNQDAIEAAPPKADDPKK